MSIWEERLRNIESKYRCGGHEPILRKALQAGAIDQGRFQQVDDFFEVPSGRLKLRQLGQEAQLIAYHRHDLASAKPSDYHIFRTSSPQELLQVLSQVLPCQRQVVKWRHLLLYSQTRIHLDEVQDLGNFVELETAAENLGDDAAQAEHDRVAELLGLHDCEPIAVAYADLLAQPLR